MSISTHAVIESILAGESVATDYSAEVLAEACATLNSAYRQGNPIVDDATYDQVFIAGLASLAPDHAFLREVEAEVLDTNSPTVRHATPCSVPRNAMRWLTSSGIWIPANARPTGWA